MPGDGHTALEPVEPSPEPLRGVVGSRQQDARAHQLEEQTWRGGTPQLGEPVAHDLRRAGQLRWAKPCRLAGESFGHVFGHVEQTLVDRIRYGRNHDQVAQPLQQVFGEASRVLAGLDDLVDGGKHRSTVAGGERVDRLVEQRVRGVAEQRDREIVRDSVGSGATEQLVEHAQGVTDGAAARSYDQRQRGRLDGDAFLRAQRREVVAQQLRRYQPERIVVRTRADRADDLVRLGRREDELQVWRRLLDELEQGVETLTRDHVRLVDDVDLVRAVDRREERSLAQVTRVVDAAVARCVDLDDVDLLGCVVGGDTVELARENARAGRLAAAAGPGEQVRMVHAVVRERVLEGLGHV